MHTSMEQIPLEELARRHRRCRELLAALRPDAGGMMVFGRVNIYYLTGAMGAGVFWLPLEGEPLLLVRKGVERVRLDSPCTDVVEYRSFSDLTRLAEEHGTPLTPVVAAEQDQLSWALAENLQKRLPHIVFRDAASILSRARAVKSPWELAKMRVAGERHALATEEMLPKAISPGMTEQEIGRTLLGIYLSLGSCGLTRMSAFGEELYLGQVCVGDSGNYPSFYNGPLGGPGFHPASPYLGSPGRVWTEGKILTADTGFCHEGYNSDKTLCYFAGARKDIPAIAQKAHNLCREIEERTAADMRPGAIPLKLYRQALDMAREAGFGGGFMGHGGNQVPFLGHGIGLNIDEWPVLANRFESPLEAGMTIAVEPKIGLPGIGMVGTENTWEVTEDGAVCLTGGVRDFICVE